MVVQPPRIDHLFSKKFDHVNAVWIGHSFGKIVRLMYLYKKYMYPHFITHVEF